MKLIIASNNKHKIGEIKAILQGIFFPIVDLKEAGITCEPQETGKSFLDNALIKAREIAAYAPNTAVLADDTGLCVDALNGEPGVRSARYAGDHDSAKNRRKLLEKLQSASDRSAHFETAAVLLLPSGETVSAIGRVDGYILETESGTNGFGYDSLFYSAELGKSFAEASEEEKNSVSHRARALTALLKKLNNF